VFAGTQSNSSFQLEQSQEVAKTTGPAVAGYRDGGIFSSPKIRETCQVYILTAPWDCEDFENWFIFLEAADTVASKIANPN
jgi:hypothetical protein